MFMKNAHSKSRLVFLLFILSALINYPVSAQEDDSEVAIQWKPWEHNLVASEPSEQGPPASLEVVFTGPGGEVFPGTGFTDDGINYTIRAVFPDVGTWKWKTTSNNNSDKGIHNIRGRVEVSRYVGENALYHHGDIRVSDDKRYLIHADGTPFIWIGDTGWNATYNSTMEDWKTYVDTRAAQRFTVIQVSPRGVGNRNTASAKPDVSFKTDGTPDPEFWKDLEDKIHYANEQGILILLVGVGSAWRDTMAANPHNQKFESYITGRMASLIVVLSPSFDQLFSDELDRIAMEFQKWTTHLVTQHPGTNHSANLTYRSSTSVDFSGLQSGHQGGDLTKVYSAARQWTLDLWGGAPVKPVILLESMYDAYGNNSARNWREKDSRKPGWIAWMSGAKGFTYGAGDVPPKVPAGQGAVWMFNKDTSSYDCWQKAIEWESAWQMTGMRDFLEAFDWWNLAPSPEYIRNQETADTLQMMAACTPDFSTMVVYLPDNPRVVIDMTAFLGPYTYVWFNPQTNRYSQPARLNSGNPNRIFMKPEGWDDAVLKLMKL